MNRISAISRRRSVRQNPMKLSKNAIHLVWVQHNDQSIVSTRWTSGGQTGVPQSVIQGITKPRRSPSASKEAIAFTLAAALTSIAGARITRPMDNIRHLDTRQMATKDARNMKRKTTDGADIDKESKSHPHRRRRRLASTRNRACRRGPGLVSPAKGWRESGSSVPAPRTAF